MFCFIIPFCFLYRVGIQRAAYRAMQARKKGEPPGSRATILADQIEELEKIGFEWDPPPLSPPQ